MSFPSKDLANQTTLQPSNLYSINPNLTQNISISSNGIQLGGDLTTTPIYATLSQTGISTTNVNGFNILSKLNMNSNDINNVNAINSTTGGFDLTIGSSNQININSYDNVNINTGVNLIVNSNDSIILNPTATFQVSSAGNVDISSGLGGVQITSPNDYINFICPNSTYFNLTTELTGDGTIYCQNIYNTTNLYCQTPYTLFKDGTYNTQIKLDLETTTDQLPSISISDDSGKLTYLKSRGLYQDGHYNLIFENYERFFKQQNPFSFKQYTLADGDFIEMNMPFILVDDGIGSLKLRNYSDYLDDGGTAGWSCIVSNMNGGDIPIDTGGIDWYAHSNGLSGNPINIKKWATCRITLIFSNNLGVYRWAVSEF